MTTWLLVLWTGLHGTIAQEFASRQACEQAAKAQTGDYSCVVK